MDKLYDPPLPCEQICVLCGHITWYGTRSSVRTILFYPLVSHTLTFVAASHARLEILRYDKPACRREIILSFKLIQMLLLHPFTSTRHPCINFQVSTSFRSSALIENGTTLDVLVDLYGYKLSGNTISYWRYIDLHTFQFWVR